MKTNNLTRKREVVLFSFIVIVLSSLICLGTQMLENPNLSILSVFTPSLVALVLTARTTGKEGIHSLFVEQTVKKAKTRWFLISLVGIPVLASLAVITVLNLDFSKFHLRSTQLLPQIIIITLIAFGEEYGWRGFLLPRLMKDFSVLKSSLIVGIIWGTWHFPAYLMGVGVPSDMSFLVFALWVILGSLFIGWLYYYSKSVLTSILAHMSANAAFNYLFILPEFTGNMETFWIFLIYLSIVLIFVYYRYRRELI